MNRSLYATALACTAVVAGFSLNAVVRAEPAPIVSPAEDAAKMTDANVLALLMAVNDDEIAAADVAMTKNADGSVKDYAGMMKKQHTENNEKTKELATKTNMMAEETPGITAMKAKDAAELEKLKGLDGADFDKGYIDMMVTGHTGALSKLDNVLPNIQNADLKKHIETTRGHVQHHLDKAKDIQAKLEKPKM